MKLMEVWVLDLSTKKPNCGNLGLSGGQAGLEATLVAKNIRHIKNITSSLYTYNLTYFSYIYRIDNHSTCKIQHHFLPASLDIPSREGISDYPEAPASRTS